MHPRIAELLEFADTARAALLEVAERIPAERFTERPAPDRWSAAELLEHLARVESGCAHVIAKRAARARESGVPAESEDTSMLGALEGRHVTDRTRKLVAPAIVAPAGGLTRDGALDAIAKSRAEFRDAVGDADGLALREVRHTHVVLGEIDLYQWILFVGLHERRHLLQLEEIATQLLAATG